MQLRPSDFGSYFRTVHGHDPFPWQQALVDRLAAEDRWPTVLDLPTGTGKTAALDIAVFHLALRAEEPRRKAPLRIVLVVDRRLVVDDAFARAMKIDCALATPPSSTETDRSVVGEVARRLCRLAGGEDARPLIAQRLRGGAPLEHDWARTPTQPTILCSTVDQVGSRLLFRGYGVSNCMKPVHAGLLGKDTLILLDEAHLSEPFRQTLAAARHLRRAKETTRELGQARVETVLLSATPGASDGASSFSLTPSDRAHPVLQARLEARKPVRLKPTRIRPVEALAREAQEMAERLWRGGVPNPAVGIVVNQVNLARDIFNVLNGTETETPCECLLMIGRARAVDRDRIADKLADYRTGSPDRSDAGPLLVVATQCLEVGVDLDLDGLVTQAASLDALRQRFGRLNRAGRNIPAEGTIIAIAEDVTKKANDPVYGDRIRKTWKALTEIAKEGGLDFGAAALDNRLRESLTDASELAALRAQPPVLMPAYLDLWSQTSPPPAADPEVGLFLHGAERAAVDVSIVWRGDLSSADLNNTKGVRAKKVAKRIKKVMKLVPPRTAEAVQVPIWAAAAWLNQPLYADPAHIADAPARDEPTASNGDGQRMAFRWAGPDDPRTGIVSARYLRPGDVLVVPADYGGCDEFGWAPYSRHVVDVADEAAFPYRHRRYAVRVARDVVRTNKQWARIKGIIAAGDGVDSSELVERLLDALPTGETSETDDKTPEDDSPRPRNIHKALERLRDARHGRGGIRQFFYDRNQPELGTILIAPHGITGSSGATTYGGPAPATEDETLSHTSRRRSGRAITVDEHAEAVVANVERFTEKLHLPPEVANDLRLAALLHDAGKADVRFQTLLAGGNWWNLPAGPAIAKSGRSSLPGTWKRAGLADGWRHEALSVRMALEHPRFADAHDPELVLWLIGTHHGLGRPFFDFSDPADDDPRRELSRCLMVDRWTLQPGPGPQSLAFDFRGLDWAAMFERLKRHYGIWGLAWLEAILRLADHRTSEEEERAS